MKVNEISYSSFTEYLICPRKHLYRKILQIPPMFTPIELAYGSGFHSAIEALAISKLEGTEETSLDEMVEIFVKSISAPGIRYNGSTKDELITEAKELLTIAKATPWGTVTGVEYPIELRLADDLIVNGFIDLISVDKEGRTVITDFKSSKKRFSQNELDNHAQLTTYSMFKPDSRLHLAVFLKQKTPSLEIMETWRTDEQRNRLRKLILAVREAMEREVFYPHESFACSNCPYFEQCHKDF